MTKFPLSSGRALLAGGPGGWAGVEVGERAVGRQVRAGAGRAEALTCTSSICATLSPESLTKRGAHARGAGSRNRAPGLPRRSTSRPVQGDGGNRPAGRPWCEGRPASSGSGRPGQACWPLVWSGLVQGIDGSGVRLSKVRSRGLADGE